MEFSGNYEKAKEFMLSEYKKSNVCFQKLCKNYSFPELTLSEQVKLYGELAEMIDGDRVIRIIEGDIVSMGDIADIEIDEFATYDGSVFYVEGDFIKDRISEIRKREQEFIDGGISESDFYAELVELGVEPNFLKRNISEPLEVGMEIYCEEHGLA